MNTTKFMGSQSLNVANQAINAVLNLQNEIDANFTPSGVLTASGGLVGPSGSVISTSIVLTSADSGKTFAIDSAATSDNITITIPITDGNYVPGFSAKFVLISVSSHNITISLDTNSPDTDYVYGVYTVNGTSHSLSENEGLQFAGSHQTIGDYVTINVIDETHALVVGVAIAGSGMTSV